MLYSAEWKGHRDQAIGPRLKQTIRSGRANESVSPKKLQRFHDVIGNIRGIALSGLVVITIFAGLAALVLEVRRNQVQIEPLSVPKSLSDKGFTGKVIASRLKHEVEKIKQSARTTMKQMNLETSWSQTDIVVPGAELSLKSMAAFLRKYSWQQPPTTIAGSLYYAGTVSTNPRTIILRVLISHPVVREIKISGEETKLDLLISKAAKQMVLWTEPYILASHYHENNEYGEVEDVCRHILKEFKRSEHVVRCHNLMGIKFFETYQHAKAVEKFELAIQVAKSLKLEFAPAHANLARVHFERAEYDKAIEKYSLAIRIDGDYAEAFYRRGVSYHKKKNHRRAVRDLNTAIKLNRDFIAAFKWRSAVHEILKRPDLAKKDDARARAIERATRLESERVGNSGVVVGGIPQVKLEDVNKAGGAADQGGLVAGVSPVPGKMPRINSGGKMKNAPGLTN